MTGRPSGLAALTCLSGAGAVEGLLLAQGPILRRYSAVRLGPEGILVDLDWLCVLTLAALGALAGLAPRLRVPFLTLLAAAIAWSLAPASQHPWWILGGSTPWQVRAPSTAALTGHAVAVTLACAATLVDALDRHRQALDGQDLPPAERHAHLWRLGTRGLALASLCLLLGFLLSATLDGLAAPLRGAVRGPAAFALLLGSTALLLAGLAILAFPGRPRKAA